jgi:Response regulator receiver domain
MAQPSLIGQGWWSISTRPRHHSKSPPHHHRALIVEDETMIALSLKADMQGLGFDTCDLAADGQQASRLAMSNQPDVVLVDVNLGREGGLRLLGGFARYATHLSSSSPDTLTAPPSSASTNRYRKRQCYLSRFIVIGSPMRYRWSRSISTDYRRSVVENHGYASPGSAIKMVPKWREESDVREGCEERC